MSGAGKSTLSGSLAQILTEGGSKVEVLDGDDVRTHLSKGLTFSKEDRDTNVMRIGWVAQLLARNGIIAMTAAISPYTEVRNEVRAMHELRGIPFVEIYACATVEALATRDVKGLYKKALAGEIAHFTGITDPYEVPDKPEITVKTDSETVQQSLEAILSYLRSRGLLNT